MLLILAVCWSLDVKLKPIFVLVKGYLQGATKNSANKKLTNYPPVSKKFFFENFKTVCNKLNENGLIKEKLGEIEYFEAKNLAIEYNKALDEFHKVYKDWIRTDRQKYYSFK